MKRIITACLEQTIKFETEEEFEESLRAVEEIGFSGVHVFRYSKRKGTRAAEMTDQIDGNTKNERSRLLMKAAAAAAEQFRQKNIGRETVVLFERYDAVSGILEGHSDNYIRVYCPTGEIRHPEQMVDHFGKVLIENLYEDGLSGTITASVSADHMIE